MHRVFKNYVEHFLSIILQDEIFNKYEFVIIMQNVLQSMQYLKESSRLV